MKTSISITCTAAFAFAAAAMQCANAADQITITPGGITVKQGDGSITTLGTKVQGSGSLMLNASGQRRTISCRGRAVLLNGSSNVLTFRGPCGGIQVNGSSNVVTIEATPSIHVTGADNRVSWIDAINGQAPSIVDSGENNVVSQKAGAAKSSDKTEIVISGAGASVETQTPAPSPGVATPGAPSGVDESFDQGERIVVDGPNNERTLECRGKDVEIAGSVNRIDLIGVCNRVEVTGSHNQVSVNAARVIDVSGTFNSVTWLNGIDGKRPKIANSGMENRIVHAAAR